MIDDKIRVAVERFAAEWQRYENAAVEVAKRVLRVADEASIGCTVTPRAKDVRSFHNKIFKKGYADPWRDVTDKAGVRAVVHTARNVDQLLERLKLEFGNDMLSVEDKCQVLDPTLLSYSGVHAQVVAERKTDEYEAIECEIQLRTAAQDAWSIVSHQVLYKPVLSLPPAIQHAVYRLVALVELFDEEVQRVMDLLPTLPGNEVLDLLEIAENSFLPLAHSPSDREVSVQVLQSIAGCIDEQERNNYRQILETFINSKREELTALYEEYGTHSALSYIPSYLLFGQAESLIILERLNAKPNALAALWRTSDMPYEYLETLAGLAGIPLPE